MIIGVAGLGLIGGSLARALYESGKHFVLGFDINKSSVLAAKLVGAIKEELTDDNIEKCDIIIVALYPHDTVEFVERNAKRIISPDTAVI